MTTLPPSCTDCLEIWDPQPPGTLRACPGLYRNLLYLFMVPRLRRLVARPSPRRPGLGLRSVRLRYLVDETALGQVFLLIFCFLLTIIPPVLDTHLHICVALTRRRNERSIGTFLKSVLIRKSGTIGQKNTFPLFLIVYIRMYKYHIYITCVYTPTFPRICPLFGSKNFRPFIFLKFAKTPGFLVYFSFLKAFTYFNISSTL